jgi:RNA polymerase sigma factor (sigma-70 family)
MNPNPDPASVAEEFYPLVFKLALRMLMDPTEAEDATQDILLLVLRGLPGFRGEAKLSTWVFSIARNHLLSRKRKPPFPLFSFEDYEAEVGAHLDFNASQEVSEFERRDYEEELKISCTMGMLQCLGPTDRLCFILNAFFGLGSAEAGKICGLTAEAYRQRLSRAKKRLGEFMLKVCGLTGGADCSCRERLAYARARGRVPPARPFSSLSAARRSDAQSLKAGMEGLDACTAFFRSEPELLPGDHAEKAARIVASFAQETLNPISRHEK